MCIAQLAHGLMLIALGTSVDWLTVNTTRPHSVLTPMMLECDANLVSVPQTYVMSLLHLSVLDHYSDMPEWTIWSHQIGW